MAKTIKFNLILDEKAVRNLDGLRENFSIEDLLKYHKNGLLLRWLEVREYQEEAEQVKKIKGTDDRAIVRTLAHIFKLGIKDSEIDKATEILKHLADERRMNAEYRKDAEAKENLLRKYHEGYANLLDKMERHKDNMTALKADAIDLERNYERLFALDYEAVYDRFCDDMPKVVLSILSRDTLREYWDDDECVDEDFLSEVSEYGEIFGDSLKVVQRNTEGVWDNIAPPDVDLIVLRISSGSFVKNYGDFNEKLSAEDVNGEFLKFHGLQYQSNFKATLLYVEV